MPTLGSDDLTFFKCFRVMFSLKKKTIQFPLSFNLYFQQKEPQSCQFATYKRNALFGLLTSQTGQMAFPMVFQRYHEVVMYLFSSLAKGCTLF